MKADLSANSRLGEWEAQRESTSEFVGKHVCKLNAFQRTRKRLLRFCSVLPFFWFVYESTCFFCFCIPWKCYQRVQGSQRGLSCVGYEILVSKPLCTFMISYKGSLKPFSPRYLVLFMWWPPTELRKFLLTLWLMETGNNEVWFRQRKQMTLVKIFSCSIVPRQTSKELGGREYATQHTA